MSSDEFDLALRQTLEDYRLSRGEKRALAQLIQDQAADETRLALLRSQAFAIVRNELAGPQSKAVFAWLEDVIKLLQPAALAETPPPEVFFSPEDNCAHRIVQQFRRVERQADICVFTITDDDVSEAILDAHHRGVSLRILTDNDKAFDRGSDIARFQQAGIPLRIDRSSYHMHHKFAIFDDAVLLTGSYNWTRGAARFNEENFLITHDVRLCHAYRQRFERLWATFG